MAFWREQDNDEQRTVGTAVEKFATMLFSQQVSLKHAWFPPVCVDETLCDCPLPNQRVFASVARQTVEAGQIQYSGTNPYCRDATLLTKLSASSTQFCNPVIPP